MEIYCLWRHFTLRVRDITSVGSGFPGYLKIGTSSYHCGSSYFMRGAYDFHDAVNVILKWRDRK